MRVSSYLLQDKGNHPRNQSNQPFLQDPQGTKKKVVSGLGANNTPPHDRCYKNRRGPGKCYTN